MIDNADTTSIIRKNVEERSLAVKKLTAVSGKKAEDALMIIAGEEGDKSAIELIRRLNALELGQIIKKFDPTIPSTTAWLADPLQIVKAMIMDPNDWESITDQADILTIQDEALNLLVTILLTNENEKRQLEILEAIAANEAAFFYLCFPFIGHDIIAEKPDQSFLDRTPDDVIEPDPDGDDVLPINLHYRELLFDLRILIENLMPELAECIKEMVESIDVGTDSWGKLKDHILTLQTVALGSLNDSAGEAQKEEFEDMFD